MILGFMELVFPLAPPTLPASLAMQLFLLDDPLFDEHASDTPHPERPERLAACRRGVDAITSASWTRIAPRPASEEELAWIHRPAYVEALLAASGSSGFFDADTYYNARSVDVARAASGGTLALVESLHRTGGGGLALLRPPGHHARPNGPMGFCLLNHVALAAAQALHLGAKRVAIVDWDVHHGNGTEEAFYDDPRVLYISTHQHPHYPGTGAASDCGVKDGLGFNVNIPLPAGATGAVYDEVFHRVVAPILSEYEPELLLVSAGFDAHARDPLGNMHLTDDDYAAMTRILLGAVGPIPVAVLLEGGYDLKALEGATAATLRALVERDDKSPHPPQVSAAERSPLLGAPAEAVQRALRHQTKFWRSL